MYTGPHLIKDNLVFGYDTGYGVADPGASTRFFKGKPTSNIANGAAFVHDTSGGSAGSCVDAPEKGPGWKKVTITARGSNFRIIQFGSYPTMASNVTYASSFEADWGNMRGKGYSLTQDGSGGGNRNYFKNGSYATGVTSTVSIDNTLLNGHVGMNITKTVANNGTHVHVPFIYNGGTNTTGLNDYFYYKEYQQEVGTIPTPYVGNTRSNTESLIDLKRTADIDVSNVSFDSTGQPTFDGSNDQIVVEVDDIVRNTSNITIEGIVNATSISSAGPWAVLTDHASAADKDGFWWHYNIGNSVYFRVEDATAGEQGTAFSGTVPFVANTYEHVVTVVGDNNVKIYVNGVLSKSYTPNFKWNRIDSSKTAYLHIGRTYPNYYLSCAIPVFKMHNKELTVDEIKQNFNAYKNRFDI